MFWLYVEAHPRRALQLAHQGEAFHLLLSSYSCFGSIEKLGETLVASTFHLLDLLAVLIDLEGGHALDACSLGGFRVSVYIDLLHSDLGIFGDLCYIDGSNSLARRAPTGGEIDNEGLSASSCSNGRIEVCKSCEHDISVVCHRESLFVSSFLIIVVLVHCQALSFFSLFSLHGNLGHLVLTIP